MYPASNGEPAAFSMHPMISNARAGGPAFQSGFHPLLPGNIPSMPHLENPHVRIRAMDNTTVVAHEREIEVLKYRVARGEKMNEVLGYRMEATEYKLKEITVTMKERDAAAMV